MAIYKFIKEHGRYSIGHLVELNPNEPDENAKKLIESGIVILANEEVKTEEKPADDNQEVEKPKAPLVQTRPVKKKK